ncbi:UNVERIFIED_CONTAM: hypothetical protein FKN15_000969 [Acipenser sinensis]
MQYMGVGAGFCAGDSRGISGRLVTKLSAAAAAAAAAALAGTLTESALAVAPSLSLMPALAPRPLPREEARCWGGWRCRVLVSSRIWWMMASTGVSSSGPSLPPAHLAASRRFTSHFMSDHFLMTSMISRGHWLTPLIRAVMSAHVRFFRFDGTPWLNLPGAGREERPELVTYCKTVTGADPWHTCSRYSIVVVTGPYT